MAAIKALELWCKMQCDGYRDVTISNMTTSFKSGLAFCALIHKYRPDLINYDSLKKEDVFENNTLAFRVAEEKLGIPALLDAEDMVALRIPDRLSILTYVSQYYNYFKGHPSMGGVKRPAEGSKEEPSEKKNLPVTAKTFVRTPTSVDSLPAPITTQTSPTAAKDPVQEVVLGGSANKNGTLNSKCVACKTHVHLVQRHFVDGKLYHRSCFKCSECSSVLHAGGYKAGKEPDTFISNGHQNKSPPCEARTKSGPAGSAVRPDSANQSQPAPRPTSVLSAPVNVVVKPVSPGPPSQSWTASAQKTQAARQRFFQATPPITEGSTGNGKLTDPGNISGKSKVTLIPENGKSVTAMPQKNLAEKNCNNNNRRPFTIRSAERRFGDEPRSHGSLSLRKNTSSQRAAGSRGGQLSTSQTNSMESSCLKPVSKDSTRPTSVHTPVKDPVCPPSQPLLTPVKCEAAIRISEAAPCPQQLDPGSISVTSSNVSVTTIKPPPAPPPAVSPVSSAPVQTAQLNESSPPKSVSKSPGVKRRSHSPVKSAPGQLAAESISVSPTAPANHGNPSGSFSSGAKKGKYLSPTNAFRTEMRSPSVKSYRVPLEQIERELNDIETNLAHLEKEGVELEKKLRSCEEEGDGDILMEPLMVDWFNLIRQKQMYIRKESELVYIAQTLELERQQPGVEWELRRLLEKPDHLKTTEERQQEKKLLQRLVEIVDGRNAIVDGLDEDRLREVEEDKQLNEMMQNLRVKKSKNKRKSSFSKLFRRRSKRQVE
ncbi:MICAL-like protein 2a [Thalassophryne amazonica]|uniref:MICAL-like protein 2a n=1 Tax=Thalassophryne amazonica TaxID=390379 RepID=UPI001470E14F|nr:MICAL-like protein 2a [Thalassophryne amazonica]